MRASKQRIIRRGGLWNSFVMVGRVARMLGLLREVRSHDAAQLELPPVDPDVLGERSLAEMGVVPPWRAPLRATA